MTEIIREFRGKYAFLSNFHISTFALGGQFFPSVEHAYQTRKTIVPKEREEMLAVPGTPGNAKRRGQKVFLRPDWNIISLPTMRAAVLAKFVSDMYMAQSLVSTGDAILQEGNSWGDTYWGVDLKTGVGENNMGKILMETRERVRRILESPDPHQKLREMQDRLSGLGTSRYYSLFRICVPREQTQAIQQWAKSNKMFSLKIFLEPEEPVPVAIVQIAFEDEFNVVDLGRFTKLPMVHDRIEEKGYTLSFTRETRFSECFQDIETEPGNGFSR